MWTLSCALTRPATRRSPDGLSRLAPGDCVAGAGEARNYARLLDRIRDPERHVAVVVAAFPAAGASCWCGSERRPYARRGLTAGSSAEAD